MATEVKAAEMSAANLKTIEPANAQELASALAQANRDGLAVIPRGAGTKSSWGNAPTRADVVISTSKMNRVLEHAWADLTVTVEAGCTIAELQRTLAQHGQCLGLDPLWPEQATIGGVLSTNDTGALRYRYGGLRDLIIGVTLALTDGTLAVSGGKVVKNVAGYDLPKLVTGALGTLGIITTAVFRLHPLPKSVQNVSIPVDSLRDGEKVVLKIIDSDLVPVAVQLRALQGQQPSVDVMFDGTSKGIEAQMKRLNQIGQPSPSSSEVWARLAGDGKISILPSQITETFADFSGDLVMEATGIGWIKSSNPEKAQFEKLRSRIERNGGSLVLMRRVEGMDAWGSAGDALAMMREVKRQFDPKNTLNPGRFVNGI